MKKIVYNNGIITLSVEKNSNNDEKLLDTMYKNTNKKLESVDIDTLPYIW